MNCDDLRDDYLAYALGTLAEPEASEIRAHLARQCDQCAAGVREASQFVHVLAESTQREEPSRALRGRILAIAGGAAAETPSVTWRWNPVAAWLAAASMALAAFLVIMVQSRRNTAEIETLKAEAVRSGMEAAALRDALSMLQSPEVKQVTFGQGTPAPPRGRVFYDSGRILLIASNLPKPPEGKTYEMWVIPKGGAPVPAGLFSSDAQGVVTHLYRAAFSVSPTDTVAVTIEEARGAPAPTSTPLFAVPL